MPELVISFLLDVLVVLVNFLLPHHILFLLLHEGSHAEVRVLEEIPPDEVSTETRLLHFVCRGREDYPTIAVIVLLLLGRGRGASRLRLHIRLIFLEAALDCRLAILARRSSSIWCWFQNSWQLADGLSGGIAASLAHTCANQAFLKLGEDEALSALWDKHLSCYLVLQLILKLSVLLLLFIV